MSGKMMGAALSLVATLACSGGGSTSAPTPQSIDPALESQAVSSTAIDSAVQILFDWSLQDRDARFSGQGVARVQPPDRARVDLFGPRGEGYLSAVLDGFELRLPPGAQDAPLPPPALFWSVLGVFRPPPGAELVGAVQRNETVELNYRAGADVWRFRLESGALSRAEWTGDRDGRRTVELSSQDENGLPRGATYRDWPAFLELRLRPDRIQVVDGFPSDIWTLRR